MKARTEARLKLRVDELKAEAAKHGCMIEAFSRLHFRVVGTYAVDYWPTTRRAWLTWTKEESMKLDPAQVVQLAKKGFKGLLPQDIQNAEKHMASL